MNDEIFAQLVFNPHYAISSHGRIININSPTNPIKPYVRDGYNHLKICGQWYAIHRLVAHAFLPSPTIINPAIDHINRIRDDNNINNLRWVSVSENNRNRGKQEGTTSKYKGVYFSKTKNRYIAEHYYDGKKKRIGSFKTEDEAGEAVQSFVINV